MELPPIVLAPSLDHQLADRAPISLPPETSSQEDINQARRSKFSRARAAAACQSCHKRKVCCDFVAHGSPCHNCQQDAVTCVLPNRRRRYPRFDGRDPVLTSAGAWKRNCKKMSDYLAQDFHEDAFQQAHHPSLSYDAMNLEGDQAVSLNVNPAAVEQSIDILDSSLLPRSPQLISDFDAWLQASAQGSELPGSPRNSRIAFEGASPLALFESRVSASRSVLSCLEFNSSQRERELDAALLRQRKDISQLTAKLCETVLQMTELLNSKILLFRQEAAGSEGVQSTDGALSLPPTPCNTEEYGDSIRCEMGESLEGEEGERGFESYDTWFMDMINCGTR